MARLGVTAWQLKLRIRKLRLRRLMVRRRHVDVPNDPMQAFEIALGTMAATLGEEARPSAPDDGAGGEDAPSTGSSDDTNPSWAAPRAPRDAAPGGATSE